MGSITTDHGKRVTIEPHGAVPYSGKEGAVMTKPSEFAPKVSVRNLNFYYGNRALKDNDPDIAENKVTAIIDDRRVAQVHAHTHV